MRAGLRIAIGADHAGVSLKDNLARLFDERGIAYKDFGTHGTDSVDYPDFAADVAHAVAGGDFDRGLLVCGSGNCREQGAGYQGRGGHGARIRALVPQSQ